jgi:hypothetical protein
VCIVLKYNFAPWQKKCDFFYSTAKIFTISPIPTPLRHLANTFEKITCVFRPALGPTQPPTQWVPGVKRGRSVMLTAHPLLVSRLRKSRSYTSCHPDAPLWSVTGQLYLYFFLQNYVPSLLDTNLDKGEDLLSAGPDLALKSAVHVYSCPYSNPQFRCLSSLKPSSTGISCWWYDMYLLLYILLPCKVSTSNQTF